MVDSLRDPPIRKQRKKQEKKYERVGTKIGEESNFEALLDQFWSHLGPFGPSWAYLGTLFGPVWGYLGLLEAILGHLGGILEVSVFLKGPG